MMQFNYAVWTDAGLLREYMAHHYGRVLTDGGTDSERFWAMKFVARQVRLTGLTASLIVADVRADYRCMQHARVA